MKGLHWYQLSIISKFYGIPKSIASHIFRSSLFWMSLLIWFHWKLMREAVAPQASDAVFVLCPMFVQSSHVTAIVFGVSIISVFTLANPHQRTPPTPIHVKATLPTSGNCGLVSEAGVASRFSSQEMRLLLFSRLLPFGLLKIELKLYAIKAATE